MLSFLQKLYDKSPIFFQNVLISLYGGILNLERYGKKFEAILNELNISQFDSINSHINRQNNQLKLLINHAYSYVPYYKELFRKNHLKPDDIRGIDDLYKIPLLTRNDIKTNFNKLIATNININKLKLGHTSGTTGAPLEFYWDKNLIIMTNAMHWRQRNWAGLKLGDNFAVLLGRVIVPTSQTSPPFWRYEAIHNQLFMSCFHLTNKNIKFYINKLKKFKPVVLEGYPSSLFIIAKYLENVNSVFPVKSILTTSETLHEYQREIIEKSFCCKVFDYYGMAERVIFAFECQKHEGHHLNMEYGITEILKEDCTQASPGQMGRIVATGLHNYAMPLIRYQTSDVSSIKKDQCSCGRALPLLENVTTKAEDIITTKDGRYIPPSILTHPFKPLKNIYKSQIIQEDIDNLFVKIIKQGDFNENDSLKLIAELKKRVGSEINIHIEFVDDIPTTGTGKFRWVISKVPLKF